VVLVLWGGGVFRSESAGYTLKGFIIEFAKALSPPMVGSCEDTNCSVVSRMTRADFPTPPLPISTILYGATAIFYVCGVCGDK